MGDLKKLHIHFPGLLAAFNLPNGEGRDGVAAGTQWVEAREAGQPRGMVHRTRDTGQDTGQSPQGRMIRPQMSIVPRVRNPNLKSSSSARTLKVLLKST